MRTLYIGYIITPKICIMNLNVLREVTARLNGMTRGLPISDAIFFNTATSGLYKALSYTSHDEVQEFVVGAAGSLLGTSDVEQRTQEPRHSK